MIRKEDEDGYDFKDYLIGTGSGAATGATTGMAFGPYGAAIGGLIGAGLGAYGTYEKDQALQDAQDQQADLERQLGNNSLIDAFQSESAMRAGVATKRAQSDAQSAAARYGLTPSASIGLERRAVNDAQQNAAYDRAAGFSAAASAEQNRRAGVLGEFSTAQSLADNATSGIGELDTALADLTRASAYYGDLKASQRVDAPQYTQLRQPDFNYQPQLTPQEMAKQGSDFNGEFRFGIPTAQERITQEAINRNPAPSFGFPQQIAPPFALPSQSPQQPMSPDVFKDVIRNEGQLLDMGVDPLYINAAKILQTAEPGSAEFNAALAIMEEGL